MEFDKQAIIDLLKKEGKNEHVRQALNELPDKVDHEQHAQMLEKFGIDPGKLAAKAAEGVLGEQTPAAAPGTPTPQSSTGASGG